MTETASGSLTLLEYACIVPRSRASSADRDRSKPDAIAWVREAFAPEVLLPGCRKSCCSPQDPLATKYSLDHPRATRSNLEVEEQTEPAAGTPYRPRKRENQEKVAKAVDEANRRFASGMCRFAIRFHGCSFGRAVGITVKASAGMVRRTSRAFHEHAAIARSFALRYWQPRNEVAPGFTNHQTAIAGNPEGNTSNANLANRAVNRLMIAGRSLLFSRQAHPEHFVSAGCRR